MWNERDPEDQMRQFNMTTLLETKVIKIDLIQPEHMTFLAIQADVVSSNGDTQTLVIEVEEAMRITANLIATLASCGHPTAQTIARFLDSPFPPKNPDKL
jgi:hypothetical protein